MTAPWGRSGLTAVLLLVAFSGAAWAHKEHRKPSPSPSPSASPSPGVPSAGSGSAATAPTPAPAPQVPAAAAGQEPTGWAALDLRATLLAHLHNKIVHFPLALGVAAAVFLIAARRWTVYGPAGRVLLLVAALAAVAAYLTGQAQEEPFEDGPLHEILEWHERMGITTGITLWAGVLLGAIPRTRRWLWLYGCVLAVLLAVTGFLGGVLSHGELLQ